MAKAVNYILPKVWFHKMLSAFCVVGILLLSFQSPAYSQQVPIKIQAVVLKKVFLFVKSLKSQDIPRLLVVYNDANTTQKDEVVDEFTKLGITAGTVKQNQLSAVISHYDVVFVIPGCTSVKSIIRSNGLLSITNDPTLVEQGDCSISIDEANGKPKIVVNMNVLKAEGQELSSELLKISRIIQ